MRPTLHLPLTERRPKARRRGRGRGGQKRAAATAAQAASTIADTDGSTSATANAGTSATTQDVATRRVREAGGPIDLASYVCICGFVFAAAVSTSVECPHCGKPQAW